MGFFSPRLFLCASLPPFSFSYLTLPISFLAALPKPVRGPCGCYKAPQQAQADPSCQKHLVHFEVKKHISHAQSHKSLFAEENGSRRKTAITLHETRSWAWIIWPGLFIFWADPDHLSNLISRLSPACLFSCPAWPVFPLKFQIRTGLAQPIPFLLTLLQLDFYYQFQTSSLWGELCHTKLVRRSD